MYAWFQVLSRGSMSREYQRVGRGWGCICPPDMGPSVLTPSGGHHNTYSFVIVIHLTGLSDKQVIREKETLFTELKDSRYEVSALKEELEKERKDNEEKQMALHKDIRKLAHKLKGMITDQNEPPLYGSFTPKKMKAKTNFSLIFVSTQYEH